MSAGRNALVSKRNKAFWRELVLGTSALVPCLFVSSGAEAAPVGGVVSHGSANIAQSGTLTTITQGSDRAVIDWQKFNLTTAETARFVQPGENAVAINRVHDMSASSIAGTLQANGHVVITNPNGVLFTKDAKVDVGSLTVSTASPTDADAAAFVSGARNDLPLSVAGNAGAKIINHGTITAKEAGLIGLVAPSVENNGILRANKGKVTLASGDTATLDLYGDGLVAIAVSQETQDRLVSNAGMVEADGGTVLLTAASAADIANGLIKVEGRLQANSLDVKQGKIILAANAGSIQITGDVHANGSTTQNAGSITATGDFVALGGNITANGKHGGTIHVAATKTLSLADRVQAIGTAGDGGGITLSSKQSWETSTSEINASGTRHGGTIRHTADDQIISSGHYTARSTNASGSGKGGSIDISAKSTKFLSASIDARGYGDGGTIRMGGEYQGGKNLPSGTDELKNADYLVVDAGTQIDAGSLGTSGNGGTVILWSDVTTLALGQVRAMPGTHAGQGGFVEISSKGDLQYKANVLTGGSNGRAGTVLLDPKNIIIANSSFDPTAIILGYGYNGGNNVHVGSLADRDNFGASISLDGTRLAIGSNNNDGADGLSANTGAVYLFTFTDMAFSGGSLQGVIGKGYTGGKNIDVALDAFDNLGVAVSLDGNRLAVGVAYEDGFTNNRSNAGSVYLYSFTDANFSDGNLESIIGYGYTGGKNYNLSVLDSNDVFGISVALDGNRLAVGALSDDGAGNIAGKTDVGAVYLFSFSDSNFSNPTLQATVGYGYTGGKNINVTSLETGDLFGRGVALSGNTLVIGAAQDDGPTNGTPNTGAAYLFSFTDALFSGGTQQSIIGYGYTGGKNIDLALRSGDQAGFSVALDNHRLAIGSPWHDGYNLTTGDQGAIFLYSFTDDQFNGLTQEAVIGRNYTTALNPKNYNTTVTSAANLGYSLSIDGNRLAVGTFFDRGPTNLASYTNNGSYAAHLFTFTDSVFSGISLTSSIGSGYTGPKDINTLPLGIGMGPDYFGSGVSFENNRLAIGAAYDDGFGNLRGDSGAVYLYSFANNNLDGAVLEGIIGYGYTGGKNYNLSTLDAGDQFGTSVSLDGNRLAVGAPQGDSAANNAGNSGEVYLFSFADDTFTSPTLQATIGRGYTGGKNYNLTLESNDGFGVSVSLDGNRLVVGAHGDSGLSNARTSAGAVYLFTFADDAFTSTTLQGTLGYNYTGGKNYNVSGLDNGDYFGYSVSLDGNRLAVGTPADDGFGNSSSNSGAVYLFSFADSSFSSPTLEAIIGNGYTGGKNVSLTSDSNDQFGSAVALEGTTLAVGAMYEDGFNNAGSDFGSVSIFAFNDLAFSSGVLDAMIGYGYTGGKNINLNSAYNGGGDYIGTSLSLNNGSLFIGARGMDGWNGGGRARGDSGAVIALRSNAGTNVAGASGFSSNSSATLGLTPGSIAALLSTPQNVILQASNDILLSDNLTVNNPSGNGGTLTLQAGRSILINALITSDNGNVNLYANEKTATGVVAGQREAGAAGIIFGTNGGINAGTGAVHIRLDDGAGRANNQSGDITLGAITAGSLLVQSAYQYSNLILNGILSASGAGDAIVLAPGGSFANNVGSNALQLTGGGRWLLYSDHKVLNNANGLTAQEQYNCQYGSCTVPVSGNALLYQYGQNLLQISANTTRQYGDANPSGAALNALLTYIGFINGDDANDLTSQVNISIAGTANGTAAAGTTHDITLSGVTDDFYSIYYGPSVLTIAKRDITATWTGGLTKTYGDANPLVGNGNFTYSGLVNGDLGTVFTAMGDFGAVTNLTGAGNYTVGALFSAANYNVTNAPTTTLTIAKKDITASWTGGISKTYGDVNPAVSSSNFTFSGLVNGDLGSAITSSANFGSITQGSNAATYMNGVTGLFNAANYNVTNAPTTTLTINKRTLTPSLTGTVSKTYDGLTAAVLALGNYNLANIYNGDDVTLANYASGTYGDKNAGTGKNVSVTGLTLTGTKASNYQLSSSSVSGTVGTILKKLLTVTGAAANNKVYDATLSTTLSNNGALVGIVGSENVGIDASGIGANFVNKNVANGTAVNVSGYALSGTDAGNYSVSNPSGLTANITPATLTLSGITASNKTYDGTVAAYVGGVGALGGVLGSDVVTLNASGASAVFGSKDVGTNKAVTVSGYALAGDDAGNYVLTQPTGLLANIVAKTITVVLGGTVSKTYNGTTDATLSAGNYTLNGAIVGDNLSLTGGLTGSYGDKNAGTGKTVSVSGLGLTGTDASNYVLSSTGVSGAVGTINRANLIVSAASGLSKIYGDADPGFTYTYTGLVGGDSTASFTGALERVTGETAGLYTISLGSLAATGNYQVGSFNPASFTINKRALTAVVHDASRLYGDANPLLNWSNVTWSNLANGDTGAVIDALSFNFGGANLTSNAGTHYVLGIAGLTDNNYTLAGFTAGNLQINKANLLIKANDVTSIAGQPLPLFTAEYIGLKNGETASVLQGLQLRTDAVMGNVGSFNILPNGATATNYTISYAPGTLLMMPATTLVPESVQQGRINNSIQRQLDVITNSSMGVENNADTYEASRGQNNQTNAIANMGLDRFRQLTGIVQLDQELQRELQ